jgi:hypothetical protein
LGQWMAFYGVIHPFSVRFISSAVHS